MKKIFFLILFYFSVTIVFSQISLPDSSTIKNYKEYNNLNEALLNPEKVIVLNLRRSKLTKFPSEIFLFKNLQFLDLSKNKILKLPDSIYLLSNLKYLILSKMGLTALPDSIGKLNNLKLLNANQNDIAKLPFSFGDLENLEVADLWSNELEYFPQSLSKLKKLKIMDLRHILIPLKNQIQIQSMLPNTKIHFSAPCQCAW